jgi:sugar phosphate isomerase/epimerase
VKLGLNLAVFADRPLDEALNQAAAVGCDAVELNTEATDGLTPLHTLQRQAATIRRQVESHGLFISALGNHAESQLIGGPFHADSEQIFHGSGEEKRAHGRERLLATARLAAELEVETVIGFTGCEDWSRFFPWPDAAGWEKMLPEFIETWTPILDEFGRLGVRFAHEPHPKQLVYDLETAERVTAALDRRLEWGFNLDTGNLLLSGVDPCAFVQALPEQVLHVHAKDLEMVAHNLPRSGWNAHGAWDRVDRGVRFRVPGWGDVPWRRFLTELQLHNYRGVVSIEHEDPAFSRREGIAKAVRFLAPLLPREPREERWW